MRFNGVELTNASLVVLFASSLATLSSGTNYVVGSYAPQLKERLHLTAAEINLVASCGNFGVYLTGPFFGYLADRKGPRALLFAGATLLGLGYFGLFWSYESGGSSTPSPHHENTTVPLPLLGFFSLCTGIGSALGNTAGLNSVARTFVPATRGLAMGIVVAGYGLSAFLYASISALLIGDNTELFLLVLAIGTFTSLFSAGLLLTRSRMENVYSLLPGASPREAEHTSLRHSRRRSSASTATVGERVFSDDEEELHSVHGQPSSASDDEERLKTQSGSNGSSLLSPISRPGKHQKKSSILVKQAGEAIARVKQENIVVDGSLGLFKVPDYYLLMIVAFCCTGTGLMWINSVGTVVVTLAEYNKNPGKVTLLQSHQTSLLSVFNCLGRLFVGAISDQARTRLGLKPVWWFALLCTTFIISQFLARASENLSALAWATSLVGFSYGQFFGLAPIVMIDWFGLKSFSMNIGFLYIIPTFSSYTFSYLFGKVYDNSTPVSSPSVAPESSSKLAATVDGLLRRAGDAIGHAHTCPLGRACYTGVFSYTIPACVFALFISIVLSLRRGRGLERREALLLDEEEFLAEVER